MDEYTRKLWERNKELIERLYGGLSGFVKEKLREEVEEGVAEQRKKQLERRKDEIERLLTQLESGFSLETENPEIEESEEIQEHFEKGFQAIFEGNEPPREAFEKFIEGRYEAFLKNHQKIPSDKYVEIFIERAEESGYPVEDIRDFEI